MLISSRRSEQSMSSRRSEASVNIVGSDFNDSFEYDEDQDEENDKYLSIPFVDNDENDEESVNRRLSANRLSRYVGIGVLVSVILAASVALSYYIDSEHKTSKTEPATDDGGYDNLCYEEPSCQNINIKQIYDPVTGFTNNTGFRSAVTTDNSCCNICLPGMNQTVCFDTMTTQSEYRNLWGMGGGLGEVDKNCSLKTGDQDYDYLLLDQIYLPQWCNALRAGHDPSLSHIAGTQCLPSYTAGDPQLNIHGLWPNYFHGFPQCCRSGPNDSSAAQPLDLATVQHWEIYPALQKIWFDPTTAAQSESGLSCATCYLLNHEWEKHGSCFSPLEPQAYFLAGTDLFTAMANETAAILRMNGTAVPTANISSLYVHRPNVICDPQASPSTDLTVSAADVGVFLELQTCWKEVIETVSYADVRSGAYAGRASVHTVVTDRATGRRLGTSVRAVREQLLDSAAPLADGLLDFVDFYGMDCPPASPAQFTTPCPLHTYLPTFAQ